MVCSRRTFPLRWRNFIFSIPMCSPKGWILIAHDVLRPRYDKHELEMSKFREIFVNFWNEEANFLAPFAQNKVKNVKFHILRKKKVRFYLTLVRKKDFCRSILSVFWENLHEVSTLSIIYTYDGEIFLKISVDTLKHEIYKIWTILRSLTLF